MMIDELAAGAFVKVITAPVRLYADVVSPSTVTLVIDVGVRSRVNFLVVPFPVK